MCATSKTLILIMALALPLPLTSEPSQSLRIGMISEQITNFFPARQTPGQGHFVRELLAPPVVAMNEQWQWTCLLCEDIPSVQNSKVHINAKAKFAFITDWRLRADLKWSDGKPVTAEDVRFTMNLLFRQSRESSIPGLPIFKVDIHPKDSLRFYISFKEPRYDYHQIMALSLLPAHKHEEIDKIIAQIDLGKDLATIFKYLKSPSYYYGPYTLDKIVAQEIILSKNPHYSQQSHAYQSLQINFQRNVKQLEDELKIGRIDMIAENILTIDQATSLIQKHPFIARNYRIISSPSSWLDQLIVNMRNPYLSDPNMRKALLFAIDRDQLAAQAYLNYGAAAYSLSPTLGRSEASIRMYPHNPELAEALLDRLGWKLTEGGLRFRHGKALQIELVAGQDPVHQEMARLIEGYWKAIGIDVSLQFYESEEYVERILKPRRFRDLALISASHMPDTYWHGRFHTRSIPEKDNFFDGLNFGSWQNKRMDQLLESYQKTYNDYDRSSIARHLQQEINNHLPMIPLCFRPKVMIVRDSIGNVRVSGHRFHSSLLSTEWTAVKKDSEVF